MIFMLYKVKETLKEQLDDEQLMTSIIRKNGYHVFSIAYKGSVSILNYNSFDDTLTLKISGQDEIVNQTIIASVITSLSLEPDYTSDEGTMVWFDPFSTLKLDENVRKKKKNKS